MLDPVLINILVDNRRTSIKLEQPMWDAIDEVCRIEADREGNGEHAHRRDRISDCGAHGGVPSMESGSSD